MSDAGLPPGKVVGPPVVYLPVEVDDEGVVQEVRMARMEDGTVALLGYTALDRFIRCCGEEQPWMLFQTDQLEELRAAKHFDVSYLDVPLPQALRSEPAPEGSTT